LTTVGWNKLNIQRLRFEYIGNKVIGQLVTTFERSGYQTGQEVIFDLFLFLLTSQNLTNPEDELDGSVKGKVVTFPFSKTSSRKKIQ
jgi:hypothetical protein